MLYCLLVALLLGSVVADLPPQRYATTDSLTFVADDQSRQQPLAFLSQTVVVDGEIDDEAFVTGPTVEIGGPHASLRPVSEILEELVGTIVPEAGRATGVPAFRGSSPKRITVTYDGVPLSHSAQREGPSLLALGMLDPSAVGSVSFGPDVLGSGFSSSQAGGVLRVGSRLDGAGDAAPGTIAPDVTVSQQFSSADRGWSARLNVSGQAGKLRYRLGGLGRILGDLRAGKSEGLDSVQPYTRLRESTFHALGSYQVSEDTELRAGILTGWRERQQVISDLESLRLSAPPSTLDAFSPRQMTLAYLTANVERAGLLRRASTTVWLNRQRETATFRRPVWEKTLFDDDRVTVVGARSKLDLAVASRHMVGLSVEARAEGVDARRKEVRDEDVTYYQRGRFPGGTIARSATALIEDRWSIFSGTTISGGLRVSGANITSDYGPSVFESSGVIGEIDRSFTGLSWFTRAAHSLGGGTEVMASVTRTFAAPGLDDVASNAFWFGGRDVPNSDVGPERAMQYEVAYRTVKSDGSKLNVSIYRTAFANRIGREWIGAGSDGLRGTNDDSFRFTNNYESDITGFEIGASQPIGSIGTTRLIFSGNLAAQHVSAPAGVARFVPPVVYRWGIRLETHGVFFEPFVRGAAETPASELEPGGRRIEATPGWATFNARVAIPIGRKTGLNLAIENIANVRYREHGSYLEAAGRNLIAALSYSL